MSLQYLITVPELLSDSPSLQEILWNFYRFNDKKERLTLWDHPYFYAELSTSLQEYGDSLKIDPTEDFRHADKFHVLTVKPEFVYITIDRVSQSSGSLSCPRDAILLKGFGIFFCYFRCF